MQHSAVVLWSLALLAHVGAAQTCATEQLTFTPSGASFDWSSNLPIASADGRFVVFRTYATNFGWSAPQPQLYSLDRATGAFDLVSQSSGGAPATPFGSMGLNQLDPQDVSQDGRFVLFTAEAANLVANDTNLTAIGTPGTDVLLRDRLLGTTMTPNTLPNGTTGAHPSFYGAMSVDGRWVVFATANAHDPNDANGGPDAHLFDRTNGTRKLVSVSSTGAPTGGVMRVDVSDDGRYVAFECWLATVVPGDTNNASDVFVTDVQTGAVERASVDSLGVEANRGGAYPRLTADGRHVAFFSDSTNLAGESSALTDIFVRDRLAGTTTIASVRASGAPINGVVYDLTYDVSADGRYVLFGTSDSGVLPGDSWSKSDVFLRDMWSGTTSLVSASTSGTFTGAESHAGRLTADGRSSIFSSRSAVLTNPPVSNGVEDIFVRECTPAAPTAYCVSQPNSLGCRPAMSSTGAPSASAATGFDVTSTNTLNNRLGTLFYGTSGAKLFPLGGGFICVQPPTRRTGATSSNGNPPPDDCSGAFHFDFNARIASGVDPALVAGQEVWCQYWSRDGASASGTNLSDALWFSIGP